MRKDILHVSLRLAGNPRGILLSPFQQQNSHVFFYPTASFGQLSSRNHPHLNNLSQLHFLVIDEADRMVQQGGFPQLRQILDVVQKANPMDDSDDEEEDGFEDDEDDPDRMLGLPGIRGESRVQMLSDDILRQIEAQRSETAGIAQEIGDEQFMQPGEDTDEDEDEEVSLPMAPPVIRQTFVYSATLTLPASASFQNTKKKIDGVEGAIAEILEKSRAKGKTKIIDLSHTGKSTVSNNIKDPQQAQKEKKGSRFKLPPGLTLQEIKCTQLHKDSHLYAYLMTTAPNGPCLVFCNSITGVKRVGATLQALKVQVRMLHANLQQVRRLESVLGVLYKCREEDNTCFPTILGQAVKTMVLPLLWGLREQSLSSLSKLWFMS